VAEERRPLIAHIIFRLDCGGLENGLVNLINNMPERGLQHVIICLAGYSDFRRRIQRSDVEIYSVDKKPGKDLMAYVRVWRLLRRLRPSVVHTRNLGTADLQWVAFLAGVRHRVHGEHGWDSADPKGQSRKGRRIRRICRPVTELYVAVSRDLASWLRTSVGIPERRIRQIYNGVDTVRFKSGGPVPADNPWHTSGPEPPIVFGTVGRLDPVKNHLHLLEAFAEAVRKVPGGRMRMRLCIVGDGSMSELLNRRADELDIRGLLWAPGSRADIPQVMRIFDVFVLPSMNEGISNTILEAMATELPIIAAAVGGNAELVVSGSTGIIYDSETAGGLTASIVYYAENADIRKQHGVGGRLRAVKEFSLDSMVSGYGQLYDDLLAS
jgi:sugar transferase (PEP-CTERM/EpsH1 system associated)